MWVRMITPTFNANCPPTFRMDISADTWRIQRRTPANRGLSADTVPSDLCNSRIFRIYMVDEELQSIYILSSIICCHIRRMFGCYINFVPTCDELVSQSPQKITERRKNAFACTVRFDRPTWVNFRRLPRHFQRSFCTNSSTHWHFHSYVIPYCISNPCLSGQPTTVVPVPSLHGFTEPHMGTGRGKGSAVLALWVLRHRR